MGIIQMVREVFGLVEQRIISGRGVLKIPQEVTWRWFRIWVRVFRDPDPNATNKRYNPERGNYANINYMAQGYVWKSHTMVYEQEVYDLPTKEPSAFLINALACNFKAIEDVLCLILPAVGAGACVPGSTIYFDAVKTPVDEIFFVCNDSTALQVALYGLAEDQTCPESLPNPKLPAGAPTPEPEVPPTTSVSTSDPYVPPDDDGNTIPFGGDTSPGTVTYPAIVTDYRFTTNCAEALIPLIFVFPVGSSPISTDLGTPLCGDSTTHSFTPNPIATTDGVTVVPNPPAVLFNGGSYFANVQPPSTIDLPPI